MLEFIQGQFDYFGFPWNIDTNIVSPDDSTLFVCSGMQKVKHRFLDSDGSCYGSVQSCLRTNDLELVGDGKHLTYFEMVGNFSFDGACFERSVDLWDRIIKQLGIVVSSVHVHPSRKDHMDMWHRRRYNVILDPTCTWSDGDIRGECCELFVGDIEIGNLVNPLGHSTDVGFGLERLYQVVEGTGRIDETSLFDQSLDPVSRDHYRALVAMKACGIVPGNKKREYVCRRLLRRVLHNDWPDLVDWIEPERELRQKNLARAKSKWSKFQDQPPEFWWSTFGILPEEMKELA